MFDFSPGNKDMKVMIENARKQMTGDTRLQFPGRSVNDVQIAAKNFGEIAELCRMFRWPLMAIRTPEPWPPSLHETLQQLEVRLKIERHSPIDDQTPPTHQPPPLS
jgi:hypothetical protein